MLVVAKSHRWSPAAVTDWVEKFDSNSIDIVF